MQHTANRMPGTTHDSDEIVKQQHDSYLTQFENGDPSERRGGIKVINRKKYTVTDMHTSHHTAGTSRSKRKNNEMAVTTAATADSFLIPRNYWHDPDSSWPLTSQKV